MDVYDSVAEHLPRHGHYRAGQALITVSLLQSHQCLADVAGSNIGADGAFKRLLDCLWTESCIPADLVPKDSDRRQTPFRSGGELWFELRISRQKSLSGSC